MNEFDWKDITTIHIHTDTNTDHGDEGKVQLFTVETSNIANLDTIFITVWAVNKVRLNPVVKNDAFQFLAAFFIFTNANVLNFDDMPCIHNWLGRKLT